VTVTTYHKAKGLEWPVVVLGSLDRRERRTAFSVLPEADRGTFDPTDPLGGRWIRYWPWPYASHSSAPLAEAVSASPEGRAVHERESLERARLLYVGFTRARDHLILAVRPGRERPKVAWLDELCDATGAPLIEFPRDGQAALIIRDQEGSECRVAARTRTFDPGKDSTGLGMSESTRWFARPDPRSAPTVQYGIAPSRAQDEWPELDVGDVGQIVTVGQRLPLGSERPSDWSRVGDALHAFLAADRPELTPRQRLERAQRSLAAFQLESMLEPFALLRSGDQLRAWIDASWPTARWHRELPIAGLVETSEGCRRIEGSIDLLLETSDGVVLIDHKSYPGRRDTWPDRALAYAPQLAAYARALQMAGKNVSSQWISFAVTGGAVRVNTRQPSRAASGDGLKG
jgi:ATP-dependent helicase/nuclease subunit A